MLRPMGSVGSALGVVLLAGACAIPSPSARISRYDVAPSAQSARTLSATSRDSLFAQSLADHEGPGVSVRAEMSTVSDSRRVRALFHADDDAYVIVGHIDADGILRIVFPSDPRDDGFVHGDKTYRTPEFVAGFASQYRYRESSGLFHYTQASSDSYDGGLGYVFVIAAWRPMRFDRFQTENAWDSFELADADYMKDPRPAIYELASLLAGDNREAYTVKFARYYNTQDLYGGYSSFAFGNGSGYCSGYEPFGFAMSPLSGRYGFFNPAYAWGSSYSYRGTAYSYDAGGDCYRTGYPTGYYYSGLTLATGAQPFTPPMRKRGFDPEGYRTHPIPQQDAPHRMTVQDNAQDTGPSTAHFSPQYRQRGLITSDEPSTGPAPRQPRIEAQPGSQERVRPAIQEMTNRRAQIAHEGSIANRPRATPETRTEARPRSAPAPRAEPVHVSPRVSSPPPAPAPRAEPSRPAKPPEREHNSRSKGQ